MSTCAQAVLLAAGSAGPAGTGIATGAELTLTPPSTVEFLVIAGGGGGGNGGGDGAGSAGGGGGAGGYLSSILGETSGGGGPRLSPLAVSSGVNYWISIGAGGGPGASGSDSWIGDESGSTKYVWAYGGGGGGGGGGATAGATGGSGGGGGGGGGSDAATPGTGTPNQGFNGGVAVAGASPRICAFVPTLPQCTTGAGGGGAGGPGGNGDGNQTNGIGGAGKTSSASGTPTTYAAGGFRGVGFGPGPAFTGNGGGGGGGQLGGSGIIIIRYPSSFRMAVEITGEFTFAVAGGYKIYSFTSTSQLKF